MQILITSLLSLFCTFSSSFVLAADFEGVIHMKSTFEASAEGRGGESDWYIKGDNIRTERRGKHDDSVAAHAMGGMIFNATTKKAYLIMPERKMYMELSDAILEKRADHLKDIKYEIVRTGKTDKVAGY